MHDFMQRLANGMAVIGGSVLTLLILLICSSVLGREINAFLNGDFMQGYAPEFAELLLATGIGPVTGDFEIVEAGIAFAIFCFIPLCQINAGHASVDIFTSRLSKRTNGILRLIAEVVFAAVLILIAVKLYEGTLSKIRNGETSLLLQFPLWWAYIASLLAAIIGAIVACYVAAMRFFEITQGKIILPTTQGADH